MTSWWESIDVSSWRERYTETSGSTSATWLEVQGTSDAWLHKDTHIPSTGVEQGEDWAEVITTQVGVALGVPCAEARLCTRNGRRGSLSREIEVEGHQLWTANVWLPGRIDGYVPHREREPAVDSSRPGVKRPGHTLSNYRDALVGTAPPPTFEGAALDGFDVLAGFHVLDALVANRDRHTENWAVLEPQIGDGPVLLAPSFDHGGSLGYNVHDDRRASIAREGQVDTWARRAWAHRLEHTPGEPHESLVGVAVRSLAMASADARVWWQSQVRDLDLQPVLAGLSDGLISPMSEPARIFVAELLDLNLRRLRDAIDASE